MYCIHQNMLVPVVHDVIAPSFSCLQCKAYTPTKHIKDTRDYWDYTWISMSTTDWGEMHCNLITKLSLQRCYLQKDFKKHVQPKWYTLVRYITWYIHDIRHFYLFVTFSCIHALWEQLQVTTTTCNRIITLYQVWTHDLNIYLYLCIV